jgi:DNA-binding LacI/PurR family transcriptional regulator
MADILLTLLAGGAPERETLLETQLVVRESA